MGKTNVLVMSCKNIYCNQPLTEFELNKQMDGKKPYRYQLCKRCRSNSTSGFGKFETQCPVCDATTTFMQGAIYCKKCSACRAWWQMVKRGESYPMVVIE